MAVSEYHVHRDDENHPERTGAELKSQEGRNTMNKIQCPNCGEVFEIDESKYSEIVAQVRNEQFEKEVAIQKEAFRREQEALQKSMLAEAENKHLLDMSRKDQQILELQARVKEAETVKELAVTQAVQGLDKENGELKARIEQVKHEAEIREMGMKEQHKNEVQYLKDALEQSRDFKMRLSTKMIGESLEQHCMDLFNRARADAFPNAYFEKDNEVVDGTKGDFIFRENTVDGIEILSIMFEMKNEADDTAKKHKNEDFLAKLDKDRQKKKCEYAVLVSTLEPDSEYYNDGIVTAYKYEKMFIVRPQFFLPLISLLRKAALSNIETRRELIQIQRENLDVQKFDAALVEFRDKFGRNCALAQDHFEKTVKEINEAIKHLEKVRDELEATGKQLNLANNKAQELTIKQLTKGNIGMQQKFLDAGIPVE